MCDHTFISVIQLSALHKGLHTCPLTHRLFRLSIWVLRRPFKPCPPWPSVPPPSDGGFMRSNIDGVRFCVWYMTWLECWYQHIQVEDQRKKNTGYTCSMHPHRGTITKHMVLSHQVAWQTTHLGSAGGSDYLTFSLNQFWFMFRKEQLILNLCQRTCTLDFWNHRFKPD